MNARHVVGRFQLRFQPHGDEQTTCTLQLAADRRLSWWLGVHPYGISFSVDKYPYAYIRHFEGAFNAIAKFKVVLLAPQARALSLSF